MGQRVKVRARGTDAIGALVDVLATKRSEQVELAKERRDFERKLQTTLLDKGVLVPEIDPQTGAVTLKVAPPQTNQFPTQDQLRPGETVTQRQGNMTRTVRGPTAPTPLNPTSLLGQLPLKEPAGGDLLSVPVDIFPPRMKGDGDEARRVEEWVSEYTPREILGRLASAVQRDPTALQRPGAQRLIQRFGLGGNLPTLEQLAVAAAQRGMTAPGAGSFTPMATDGLPNPDDYDEGVIIADDETGEQYQLIAGRWVPL